MDCVCRANDPCVFHFWKAAPKSHNVSEFGRPSMNNVRAASAWAIAKAAGRDYITPEDVTAAVAAGISQTDLWREVLQAVECGAVEDASCTAFVALKGFKVRRRTAAGSIEEV